MEFKSRFGVSLAMIQLDQEYLEKFVALLIDKDKS